MKRVAMFFLLTTAVIGLAAEEAGTALNWAFVKRAADGSAAPIDFKERVNIAPGELFKIYVQPLQGANVYLFLHDAEGDLQRLFPENFSLFDKPAYENTHFYIPEKDNWFTLDSAKGTERFYLVVSSDRLRTLEGLVLSYEKTAAAAKGAARKAVLDEIARLRAQHSKLTMAAEKPMTIAGGTRGINAAVEKVATRIDAPGFYYRLFRLEH
jgi:hypothetical protein